MIERFRSEFSRIKEKSMVLLLSKWTGYSKEVVITAIKNSQDFENSFMNSQKNNALEKNARRKNLGGKSKK